MLAYEQSLNVSKYDREQYLTTNADKGWRRREARPLRIVLSLPRFPYLPVKMRWFWLYLNFTTYMIAIILKGILVPAISGFDMKPGILVERLSLSLSLSPARSLSAPSFLSLSLSELQFTMPNVIHPSPEYVRSFMEKEIYSSLKHLEGKLLAVSIQLVSVTDRPYYN